MYVIITDAQTWAKGETLEDTFQTLFKHTHCTPKGCFIYEFEGGALGDIRVDELGRAHTAEGVDLVREWHCDPKNIFQVHDEFLLLLEEIEYA